MTPPTAEQEAALAAAAERAQTAIAAGAGAGKTTLMVEAVWRDVERDGVPLDRILVAAYNRAAAAHIAARLQARFADARDGRGADRVALDLSEAWVGTFHALAGRLVREHPFAAGVDPEFGELDDTEAAALVEQALDEAMEASMGEPGFVDLVADAGNLTGLRDATRHVHERLRAAGHEAPRVTVPAPAIAPPGAPGELERLVDEITAHADLNATNRDRVTAFRAFLASREAGAAPPAFHLTAKQGIKRLHEAANDLARRIFQARLDGEAVPLLTAFARHLDHFTRRYAALKRERGALDYEDLLLAARRVLRAGQRPALRRVYVDEFQDANALQAEIVDLLAAERTVLVGDGCQAIYGFRHADAAEFARRAGSPPEVTLVDNHRSQRPLLEALNDLLAAALADEPAFQRLTPAAPDVAEPPLADTPVEIVDATSADGGRTTREQEAEVVADVVCDLVARGYRHGQIAVLFRALTQVETYRAALAARGLPVHLVAGRGFLTHDQVADTLALLALVENPFDEEALVRVLASPYVAASDADLLALRRAAGESRRDGWPGRGALWPAVERVEGTAPVRRLVERLRFRLRERGLPGLVEDATCARGYDLAVLGLPDGARRHANLRRLVRMAGAYAAVRGPDLRGFLTLLRSMAEAGNQDPGEAVLVDPDLDAVRIATVHAVKGQQFPAVVIADGSHGGNTGAPMVVVDQQGTAGILVPRVGGDAQAALGYTSLRGAEVAAERAEERRVIYVAATRAERHLAVVGRGTVRSGDGAFEVLRAAAGLAGPGVAARGGGAVGLRVAEVGGPVEPGPRPRVEPATPTPVAPPALAPVPERDPLAGRSLSFSALSTLATCARRFHLEYERGLRGRPDAAVPRAGGSGRPGGAAFGDLVHRMLERHDWHGPPPQAGWTGAAAATAGLAASPEDLARAERQVAELLASDLAGRIRAGRAVDAERRFSIAVDGALLSGAIDLMIDEGDGRALLVDWKTHALGLDRGAAEVLAEYAAQQDLYALAALRAGHREVTLRWVVLEDLAGSPERVVRAADEPALTGRVRALLDPLRGPERPAAAVTPMWFCGGCPGLDAMCPVASSAG